MVEPDIVAVQVLGRAKGEGAVRFEGWLASATDAPAVAAVQSEPAQISADSPTEGAAGETSAAADTEVEAFRLFTDPQFLEWLQIPGDAILHQIPGTEFRDGKSVIWVERGRRITRCQSGCANHFAELEAGDAANDPTARRPRPYP